MFSRPSNAWVPHKHTKKTLKKYFSMPFLYKIFFLYNCILLENKIKNNTIVFFSFSKELFFRANAPWRYSQTNMIHSPSICLSVYVFSLSIDVSIFPIICLSARYAYWLCEMVCIRVSLCVCVCVRVCVCENVNLCFCLVWKEWPDHLMLKQFEVKIFITRKIQRYRHEPGSNPHLKFELLSH